MNTPEQRLMAHIQSTDTRWFKVSSKLLNFGLRNVPEYRDSWNPIKRLASEIGSRMAEMQFKRINRNLKD